MEMLKTTHISKKNGRFLFLFTSVLSEAYSHAHYNMQELFYDDRYSFRTVEITYSTLNFRFAGMLSVPIIGPTFW